MAFSLLSRSASRVWMRVARRCASVRAIRARVVWVGRLRQPAMRLMWALLIPLRASMSRLWVRSSAVSWFLERARLSCVRDRVAFRGFDQTTLWGSG